LTLLLNVSAEPGVVEHPACVPSVDSLATSLGGSALPVATQALLMRHYESAGQFAKAEDVLFSILDATGNAPAGLEFGAAFYDRILRQSDAALAGGNLPRPEAEEGFRELKLREGITANSGYRHEGD
jgi:hypothetical protein